MIQFLLHLLSIYLVVCTIFFVASTYPSRPKYISVAQHAAIIPIKIKKNCFRSKFVHKVKYFKISETRLSRY
jgi:hypothetical protein